MPEVRELEAGASHLAAPALLELRPHLRTAEALADRIEALRAGGYRVAGSFEPGEQTAAAAAGFRVAENLHMGRHLYVDDLVTRAAMRGRGHADALFAWLEAEARAQGCAVLHLDSGVQAEREDAHRFYFRHGMRIASYHFSRVLN
ncbi:MAG: GNAT family N-acetyltransferase [Solirubrobacteraceae bacterium]|nr:GNAT family N-acetyltransferase [Solirubrobacteraceae bacterium]